MQPDVMTLHDWYESPLGALSADVVRHQLLKMWPALAGERVLVLGYAQPYADLWPKAHVYWGMPAAMGGYMWPEQGGGQSVLVHGQALPFSDQTFDRILLIHALEFSQLPEGLLAECYRVMYPAGELIAAVPNRLGVWARREGTPFASGVPYSALSLSRMLNAARFTPKHIDGCLFMPPVSHALMTRYARWFEKAGKTLTPAMAGILLMRASKDVLGGRVIRPRESTLATLGIVRPQAIG